MSPADPTLGIVLLAALLLVPLVLMLVARLRRRAAGLDARRCGHCGLYSPGGATSCGRCGRLL